MTKMKIAFPKLAEILRRQQRIQEALFEAAVEKHGALFEAGVEKRLLWVSLGDGRFATLEDDAPDEAGLIKWFTKNYPGEARQVEAAVRSEPIPSPSRMPIIPDPW